MVVFYVLLLQNIQSGKLDTLNFVLTLKMRKVAMYTKLMMNAMTLHIISHHSAGPCSLTVVVKTKAPSADCFEVINNIAKACGGDLAPVYEKFKRMKDEFRFEFRHHEFCNY